MAYLAVLPKRGVSFHDLRAVRTGTERGHAVGLIQIEAPSGKSSDPAIGVGGSHRLLRVQVELSSTAASQATASRAAAIASALLANFLPEK